MCHTYGTGVFACLRLLSFSPLACISGMRYLPLGFTPKSSRVGLHTAVKRYNSHQNQHNPPRTQHAYKQKPYHAPTNPRNTRAGYTHAARGELEEAEAAARLMLNIIDTHPAMLHLPLTFSLAEASRRLVKATSERSGRPADSGQLSEVLRGARATLVFARPAAAGSGSATAVAGGGGGAAAAGARLATRFYRRSTEFPAATVETLRQR